MPIPFRKGDHVQHTSGAGAVYEIKSVAPDLADAYAEPTDGGCGTRILNPTNWKTVLKAA